MKKLLFLLALVSTPCMAGAACCLNDPDCGVIMPSESLRMADAQTLEFKGTIEKHLTRDAYQFIDRAGRILAEVDGDVWRAQRVTKKDGILFIG